MTLEEVLKKATEGGYHIHGSDGTATFYDGANSDFSAWTRTDNGSTFMVAMEETLLDPRFWQALGRTLDWSEACDLFIICVHGEEECSRCRGYYWMYQWHYFIQALADGHTPEAFFAHLLSSQTRSSGHKHQHQAGKEPLHGSLLLLLAQETRQISKQLFEAAAGAQEVAKDMVRMSRLTRQRRRGA